MIHSFIQADLLDLETMKQDFVMATKKIEIPGHPHAYNPSIIRWQGSLLLSFRITPSSKSKFDSILGLIWLDEQFNPIGEPQLLETQDKQTGIPSRSEDARLLAIDNQLWIVYSDNRDPIITRGGFRVYMAQLEQHGQHFSIRNIECLSKFEGESKDRREKNWVPFDYQGHLLLAYRLNPHRILRPLIGSGKCETFASSEGNIQWNWGELRGGTPALRVGDQYLSFFHSYADLATLQSDGKIMPHYFMGAYTFNLDPPFAITAISPEPIVAKTFYKGPIYQPYWKPVRVVFPCGFIDDDAYIWVAYGRQDHEAWLVKLDKQKLLQSLLPVIPK